MNRVLITAGPTIEYIDTIRYITNGASGKQGYALADSLHESGFEVKLVSGPVSVSTNKPYEIIHVKTAQEMLDACEILLPVKVAIFTAAVTDWKPNYTNYKIKKDDICSIDLGCNSDIIHYVSNHKKFRPKLVVGFALESENLLENAELKLLSKNCDWVIANHTKIDNMDVMGNDYNKAYLVTREFTEEFPRMTKKELAVKIVKKVSDFLDRE